MVPRELVRTLGCTGVQRTSSSVSEQVRTSESVGAASAYCDRLRFESMSRSERGAASFSACGVIPQTYGTLAGKRAGNDWYPLAWVDDEAEAMARPANPQAVLDAIKDTHGDLLSTEEQVTPV
jgi:hypothetical protein